jgi:hypothetical protein
MKSSMLALGGALFAWAALGSAQVATESQTPDSLKGVELKGKAPVNPQTLRVVLPRAQEATLSNGLRVALLEDHKLPTFSVQLLLTGGGLDDPDSQHGLAMVTASLLREGTAKRTSREIAEQLATLGGVFSAGASPSSGETAIGFGGLSDKAPAIFALAADIVRNPAFPEAELQKYKTRFVSQLQQQRIQPNFAAQEEFMRAVYGTHPGSYVVPPEKVLTALTRADLDRYHKAHYVPNNGIVLAYGDFTLKSLVQQLETAFGDWPQGAATKVSRARTARRSSGVGADLAVGRRPRHRAAQRRLLRAAGDESHPRRRARVAAVHQPARGQGLHVRRVQLLQRLALSRRGAREHRRALGGDRWCFEGTDRRAASHR